MAKSFVKVELPALDSFMWLLTLFLSDNSALHTALSAFEDS